MHRIPLLKLGLGLVAAVGLSLGLASGSQASVVVNGDFETATGTGKTVYSGFSGSSATTLITDNVVAITGDHSPLIPQGVYFETTGGNATALTNAQLTSYVVELDVATGGTSGNTSPATRYFEFILDSSDNSRIDFAVYSDGSVRAAGGHGLFSAGTIQLSSSQSDLQVNHIRIEAVYDSNPHYTVTVNGQSSAEVSYFDPNKSNATEDAYLNRIAIAQHNSAPGSWSVVDNLSVEAAPIPEPGSLSVLGLGMGLLMRRSHK